MSDRVQSPEQPGSTSQRRPTKQERRAAAEAAAAQASATRVRRQRLAGGIAGVVLVGVAFAALIVLPDVFERRAESNAARAASEQSASPEQPAGTPPAEQPGGTPPPSAPAGDAPNPAAPSGDPEAPPDRPTGDFDPRLAERPAVEKGSGALTKLVVTPLIQGTGPAVQRGQTIAVNYVGVSFETGKEFDASWNRGEPFQTQIGVGAVLPGWDQGLVGIKVGSRVRLDIPTELAYGPDPGNNPAGPLRFVVDVLGIKPETGQ
ncbi:FKBP-type peptidyl-prolyl cis-trans isomerase [Plantactinospora soyae]|uniref:Peptidyl-prolyl cis-trans isomerase n=1 Tax=Plantactinospora soyae TaxID=1544732 RepID=A0A927M6H9_9ACTN|nr:FKBP-type peptidyl-prolyl cis-trans isomerase [Plantactinospora soyae]MBE1489078.1 peptidylprolyl isomerase [Plantactinospora soyae]